MNTSRFETIQVAVIRHYEDISQLPPASVPLEQWLQVGHIAGKGRDEQGQEFLSISLLTPVRSRMNEKKCQAIQLFDLMPGQIYLKRLPDANENELFTLDEQGSMHPVRPDEIPALTPAAPACGCQHDHEADEEVEDDSDDESPAAPAPAELPGDQSQRIIADICRNVMNLIPALCGQLGLEATYIQNLDRYAVMINGDKDDAIQSLQRLLELYNRLMKMREESNDE